METNAKVQKLLAYERLRFEPKTLRFFTADNGKVGAARPDGTILFEGLPWAQAEAIRGLYDAKEKWRVEAEAATALLHAAGIVPAEKGPTTEDSRNGLDSALARSVEELLVSYDKLMHAPAPDHARHPPSVEKRGGVSFEERRAEFEPVKVEVRWHPRNWSPGGWGLEAPCGTVMVEGLPKNEADYVQLLHDDRERLRVQAEAITELLEAWGLGRDKEEQAVSPNGLDAPLTKQVRRVLFELDGWEGAYKRVQVELDRLREQARQRERLDIRIKVLAECTVLALAALPTFEAEEPSR